MLGYVAAAVVAVMLLVFAVKATRSPGPAQLDSTQLTFSAEPKEGPLFTDGARIYLNSRGVPSEMAASGGPVVPLHILGPGIFLLDILPDGSQALGLKPKLDDEIGRGTLWTASMLGGEPRKLTDHLALHARWSPDGRAVVFSDQSTLYKIDEDGQNLRKIWDAPGDLMALSFSPDGRQLSATVGVDPDHSPPALECGCRWPECTSVAARLAGKCQSVFRPVDTRRAPFRVFVRPGRAAQFI